MLVRSITVGVALLACASSSAPAGLLDSLFGPRGSDCSSRGGCPGASCPHGARGGICPPVDGACEPCYGGHLPCCADARGRSDRQRLYLTKVCRRLHHETFYPPAPPLFHPTWGYHQTCWRPFPPLPPCPPPGVWTAPLDGQLRPHELPSPVENGIIPPQPVDGERLSPLPSAPEYDPPQQSDESIPSGSPEADAGEADPVPQGASNGFEPDSGFPGDVSQRFELPTGYDGSRPWVD